MRHVLVQEEHEGLHARMHVITCIFYHHQHYVSSVACCGKVQEDHKGDVLARDTLGGSDGLVKPVSGKQRQEPGDRRYDVGDAHGMLFGHVHGGEVAVEDGRGHLCRPKDAGSDKERSFHFSAWNMIWQCNSNIVPFIQFKSHRFKK